MAIYQDRIMRLAKNPTLKQSAEQVTDTTRRVTRPAKSRSIDDFKSLLSKGKGMARAAKYEVVLTPPAGMVKRLAADGIDISPYTRDISLLCDTIAMPGHDLQTHSAKYGTELPTMMVNGHGFEGTITTTFYIDENHNTKSYFDLWQHMAVDRNTNKVRYYKTKDPNTGMETFSYAGRMEIYQLGGGGRTYGMEVQEVYPETIGQIEYAYATVDTLTLLPVEFQYRRWGTIHPTKLDE